MLFRSSEVIIRPLIYHEETDVKYSEGNITKALKHIAKLSCGIRLNRTVFYSLNPTLQGNFHSSAILAATRLVGLGLLY